MTNTSTVTNGSRKWLTMSSSAMLFIAFFITWVSWDKTGITGSAMPSGDFFKTSDEKFNLANPFPQSNVAIQVLWLIPAFAIITILLAWRNKKYAFFASVATVLALSL